jgi:hypothetical protein
MLLRWAILLIQCCSTKALKHLMWPVLLQNAHACFAGVADPVALASVLSSVSMSCTAALPRNCHHVCRRVACSWSVNGGAAIIGYVLLQQRQGCSAENKNPMQSRWGWCPASGLAFTPGLSGPLAWLSAAGGQSGWMPWPRLDASSQRLMGSGRRQRWRVLDSMARWRVRPRATGFALD